MIERALSAFFLLFSLGYLYAATGFSFGSLSSPKSGFLPQVVGTAAVILSLVNLAGVLRNAGAGPTLSRTALVKIGLFSAVLGLYLVLLRYAGFTAATFVALCLLLKVAETKGWLLPVLVAGGVAVGAKLTFGYLGVIFP
jgi:hypothetical protein